MRIRLLHQNLSELFLKLNTFFLAKTENNCDFRLEMAAEMRRGVFIEPGYTFFFSVSPLFFSRNLSLDLKSETLQKDFNLQLLIP
jgi:hypothetical protein